MLLHIPALLDAGELAQIQAGLAGATWGDGRATAGHEAALAKRNQQLPEDTPAARDLGRIVLQALGRTPRFTATALPLRLSQPIFNRYAEGMGYGDHIDSALRGSASVLRSDLAATLFLSDPATYDGGELVSEDAFGARAVKLAAGDLVVYPASTVHRVTPVTRGARLAAILWVQSLVRDDARRGMLHDLDRALASLRARGLGGTPELVTLSGVYHNLLRQWAET